MKPIQRVTVRALVNLGQIESVQTLFNTLCPSNQQQLVNESDEMGYNAVYAAVHRNDLPMLHVLIRAGAHLDIQDSFGFSPLSHAKRKGYKEISRVIELFIYLPRI